MIINVHKKAPLGVKEQIKLQIRSLIQSGRLPTGHVLPSARDLAGLLRVNRNTVSAAYKELAAQGFLELKPGAGTRVRSGLADPDSAKLEEIFTRTISDASTQRIRITALAQFFMARFASLPAVIKNARVLVVDCNDEVIHHISEMLEKKLGVLTRSVLIQDLEKSGKEAVDCFRGVDLVACGFNHLSQFERAVDKCPAPVMGILLRPDPGIMEEILRIPAGATIGYCCANQRSTETLFNQDLFTGNKKLHRILAGADDPKRLKSMLNQCRTIFASHYVVPKIRDLVEPDVKLISVELLIDEQQVEIIKDKLMEIKLLENPLPAGRSDPEKEQHENQHEHTAQG